MAPRRRADPVSSPVPPDAGPGRRAPRPEPDHAPAVTPDGRYLVVRGRLWRRADPALPPDARDRHVRALMDARRGVRDALRAGDRAAERAHRAAVHAAKVALGERGPVWWADGAPDYTRRLARTTPYAAWWQATAPGDVAPDAAPDVAPDVAPDPPAGAPPLR